MSRVQAFRLIKAAEIVKQHVLPMGNIPVPTHERQMRPLKGVSTNLIPRIWCKAVEIAGGVPTALQVQRAKSAILQDSTQMAKASPPPRTLKQPSGIRRNDLGLTMRDQEILELVEGGAGDKAIAERLVISYHTVRQHLKRIFRNWRVHSRGEAIAAWRSRVSPRKAYRQLIR
jgi:DNA-binding CsgD family transcriptional regulator